MTLHRVWEAAMGALQRRTKRAGNAPDKNIVALNEMILILQQIVLASVAAGVCSGGP
jgi:hypothetical protein